MAESRRGEMAAVYEEALAHGEWCPVQDADCWTSLPDVARPLLQQQLLDILPGERIVPRAFGLRGVSIPRRLGAAVVDAHIKPSNET